MIISKNVSEGFQIANLLATVLVISIHYNSKYHIPVTDIGSWNYILQEYVTNALSRIAVPFFAFSAGVFFFLKYIDLNSYVSNLKKRSRTLLIPYLIGCSVVLVCEYILRLMHGEEYELGILQLLRNAYLHPYSVQYWFLRDLMLLSAISPLIFWLNKSTKGLISVVWGCFWLFEIPVTPKLEGWYLINIETLFFFSLGGAFVGWGAKAFNVFENADFRLSVFFLFVFASLMALRVYLAPTFNNWYRVDFSIQTLLLHKLAIVIGIFGLISLSCKIKSDKLLYVSGFTFFVFLYHLFPLSKVITKIGNFIVADQYLFYLTFPLATIMSFGIAQLFNKYAKYFYDLLSGARDPSKAMKRLDS